MDEADRDTLLRVAAFDHVRRLREVDDQRTSHELKPEVLGSALAFTLPPDDGICKVKH